MLRIRKKHKPTYIPETRDPAFPITSFTNVLWFYGACGNSVILKWINFVNHIKSGYSLAGRSLYILVDIYRIAVWAKFKYHRPLLSDSELDFLASFLKENLYTLVREQLIPKHITEQDLEELYAPIDNFTKYDIDMAEYLLTSFNFTEQKNGNKKKIRIRIKGVRLLR